MLRKIISGGQTGADRGRIGFHAGLEHGGYVLRGRKAEDGRIDDRYDLIELSTSSYPARTRRNIDGTVIFGLERVLNGGTKLTLELAKKLGKPVLHIYDDRDERISNPDSLCLEIQVLGDFVCSNPERGRPSGIERARRLRLDARDVAVFESGGFRNGIHRNSRRVGGRGREEWGIGHWTFGSALYFRLEPVG
jgi:Circularly permutated YpsA SLOG family